MHNHLSMLRFIAEQGSKLAVGPGESKSSSFYVRDASLTFDDEHFIVEAFDSALPYLASIGSGEQWDQIPFFEKPGFIEETLESVEQSEKYSRSGSGDAIRILIAEIESLESFTPETFGSLCFRVDNNKQRFLSADHLGLGGEIEQEGLKAILYLEVIITDYRTGSSRKGAGEALIQSTVEYGRKAGKRTLYVDGVTGNDRKLIHYYERLGFNIVGDFSMKRRNGSTWLGTLLRIDLQPGMARKPSRAARTPGHISR
ncbi:hypothetical protein BDZ45DRAFT_739847 [Acephala macrosclerotiorum]|nr:hypothetical protein BDZ45DRAFT_739847 [Acephala macrosclerotiorum]